MTRANGPSPAAGAAAVAGVYALGGFTAAFVGHRSIGASLGLGVVVWAAVFVGWWVLLGQRHGGGRR